MITLYQEYPNISKFVFVKKLKKTSTPPFFFPFSLGGGEGRWCVFGRMFCENQFMGRVAEGVRR